MDLCERLWIILRRRWVILVACLAVAAIGAALYNTLAPKTYTASTDLFLRAPDTKTSASAYQGDLFSRQRAQTYANMLGSDELAQMVIDKLGLTTTPSQLASEVKASTITNTVIMTISATDANPQRAANIANAYGSVFADYVARVENVEFDPNVPPLVRVITTASAEKAEAGSLSPVALLVAAAVGGLGVGLLIIWISERYDGRLRSRHHITEISGQPVIGRIPPTRGLAPDTVGEKLTTSDELLGCAERLASITDRRIGDLPDHRTPLTVAVVGSGGGDGRSVVAHLLSQTLSNRGYSAKVVDAELETVPSRRRRTSSDDAAREAPTADQNDDSDGAEIVIVDTPALAGSSEAEHAIEAADAALIVVRPNRTTREGLADVAAVLRSHGTAVLGVVANEAQEPRTAAGIYP